MDELVNAVEDLLLYRDGRVAEGIPLGRLYGTLREPGRNELRRRHERIDDAVSALYGFDREEDLLAQVMALTKSIAEEEAAGITAPRGPGSLGLAGSKRTDYRLEPPLTLA